MLQFEQDEQELLEGLIEAIGGLPEGQAWIEGREVAVAPRGGLRPPGPAIDVAGQRSAGWRGLGRRWILLGRRRHIFRWRRELWRRGRGRKMVMNLLPLQPKLDHARIVAAISDAEGRTSGEIRVVISRRTTADAVAAAKIQFERLGMTGTAARNGVLIFLAPRSRSFAVIGDTGVHEKCGDAFWTELAAAMTEHFKRGDFTAGLVLGIARAGALLAENFPRQTDDRNELPNSVEESN